MYTRTVYMYLIWYKATLLHTLMTFLHWGSSSFFSLSSWFLVNRCTRKQKRMRKLRILPFSSSRKTRIAHKDYDFSFFSSVLSLCSDHSWDGDHLDDNCDWSLKISSVIAISRSDAILLVSKHTMTIAILLCHQILWQYGFQEAKVFFIDLR